MDIDVSGWQGPQEPRPAKNLAKNANLAKSSSLAKSSGLAKAPDLTKTPAALLFAAADLLARSFTDTISRRHDLTLAEWRCMMVLAPRPGLANIEVAEASGVDVMTVSRALRRLERHGRLERRADPADKRRITGSLTPKGLDLYRAVAPSAELLFEALNVQDQAQLGRYLKAVIASLR
jgi:DNA-binding MarR family transcriptional regulator